MITQFKSQQHFYLKLFSLIKQFNVSKDFIYTFKCQNSSISKIQFSVQKQFHFKQFSLA